LRNHAIVLGCLLLAGHAAQLVAEARPGIFCIAQDAVELRAGSGACREVMSNGIRFEAAPGERLFLYQDSQTGVVAVGRVSPQATRIDRSFPPPNAEISVESSSSQWPEEVALTIRERARTWSWRAPVERQRALTKVVLPRGSYTIAAEVANHDPATETIVVEERKVAARLRPAPHPFLTGSVVDASTSVPMAGVAVAPAGEDASVWTDALGKFALPVPSRRIETVEFHAAGFGRTFATVGELPGDRDLSTISLGRGGSVNVTVERNGVDVPLTLVVEKEFSGRARRVVARRELEAHASTAVIGPLEPGRYVIIASGERPLQRAAAQVDAKGGENVAAQISLARTAVRGAVEKGGDGLRRATLNVRAPQSAWSSTVETNDEGRFADELWSTGEFLVAVRHGDLSVPHIAVTRAAAGEAATWDIDVPSGRIFGRVRTATGEPVANAALVLHSDTGDTSRVQPLSAQADGRFLFTGIAAGRHRVAARVEGYLPYESPELVIASASAERELDIRLEKSEDERVLVVDAAGRPAGGATVITACGAAVANTRTDANGAATITRGRGMACVAFALPQEGSVGMARVSGGERREATRIVVPRGSAAIRLAVRDDSGKPVPDVRFIVRYEHVSLPELVVAMLESRQRTSLLTDATGAAALAGLPPGLYELWPAVSSGSGVESTGEAVRVEAQSGEYRVDVTLQRLD
jgi:hypothetical protein